MWWTTVNCVRNVRSDCQDRVRKTLLVPLPVMEDPFQRIAIDIVGPLLRSRLGNYSYPEAFTLRSIDADQMAQALVTIFVWVECRRKYLPIKVLISLWGCLQNCTSCLELRQSRQVPIIHSWWSCGLGQTPALCFLHLSRGATSNHRVLPIWIVVWKSCAGTSGCFEPNKIYLQNKSCQIITCRWRQKASSVVKGLNSCVWWSVQLGCRLQIYLHS